jgi:hypothetical protein
MDWICDVEIFEILYRTNRFSVGSLLEGDLWLDNPVLRWFYDDWILMRSILFLFGHCYAAWLLSWAGLSIWQKAAAAVSGSVWKCCHALIAKSVILSALYSEGWAAMPHVLEQYEKALPGTRLRSTLTKHSVPLARDYTHPPHCYRILGHWWSAPTPVDIYLLFRFNLIVIIQWSGDPPVFSASLGRSPTPIMWLSADEKESGRSNCNYSVYLAYCDYF